MHWKQWLTWSPVNRGGKRNGITGAILFRISWALYCYQSLQSINPFRIPSTDITSGLINFPQDYLRILYISKTRLTSIPEASAQWKLSTLHALCLSLPWIFHPPTFEAHRSYMRIYVFSHFPIGLKTAHYVRAPLVSGENSRVTDYNRAVKCIKSAPQKFLGNAKKGMKKRLFQNYLKRKLSTRRAWCRPCGHPLSAGAYTSWRVKSRVRATRAWLMRVYVYLGSRERLRRTAFRLE